jgi:hypothetical protein
MDNIPFPDLACTPEGHFKLYFYGAVLGLIEMISGMRDSYEAVFEEFPFLAGYNNELAAHGLEGMARDDAAQWWCTSVQAWEAGTDLHLPLRALGQAAGLDYRGLLLLVSLGLVEEDPRFGHVFDALQGGAGSRRPAIGLLSSEWGDGGGNSETRTAVRRLRDLGLMTIVNPDAPYSEQTGRIPGFLWEALCGSTREKLAPGVRYSPCGRLPDLEDLIISKEVRGKLEKMPNPLGSGAIRMLIVRGPRHNGRRTIVGGLARRLGRGVLHIDPPNRLDFEHWKTIGPLATLLHAIPVISCELSSGETLDLPELHGYSGPLVIVLGRLGGISGYGTEHAVTLTIDMPEEDERILHWTEGLNSHPVSGLQGIPGMLRLTSGNIRRIAKLSSSYAALDGSPEILPSHVRLASRSLNRQALDTLATQVECSGDWDHLAVSADTLSELRSVESRCRYRERLRRLFGANRTMQRNVGVRALFSGPSGTGKSLAAQLLASVLEKDLSRVDLSSVVNKYIGETEKNLNQLFSRAEELDVVLLLDEGDALLTQRTSVQNSNDRYANLETNFLLQRIESFEGILIVTTNAGNRIDSAFQRRMDVVVEFRQPEPAERYAIWRLHLPQEHCIESGLLSSISACCVLNGGQIRNAVLHASLLALSNGGKLTPSHLMSAIQREYRKIGAACPLQRTASLAVNPE